MTPNNEPKQVLVVRTTYPDGKGGTFTPRKGKLISQAAHASLKVFLDLPGNRFWYTDEKDHTGPPYPLGSRLEISLPTPMARWLKGSFTKIVVQVQTEEDLDEIYAAAKKAQIPSCLIIDAGLTEFAGVPTKTVVGIGPWWPDEIDAITGHLKLL